MAVPFNIPEDQNEVEVLINQLQTLLTKLQAAVRRSRGTGQGTSPSQAAATRVRSVASNRRQRDEDNPSTSSAPSANLPELLNNLAWLAAASQDLSSSSQLTVARSPRRRTSSESSCCEETKMHVSQEWNQVGVTHGKIADDAPTTPITKGDASGETEGSSGDGLLSKLVPSRVSAPLWTAMICFVGWHLFRAR